MVTIYCPDCNRVPARAASECSICGARLADASAPAPAVDGTWALRIRRARVIGFLLTALGAIVSYAMIEKVGPHGPGVACAVFAIAAGFLMPSG